MINFFPTELHPSFLMALVIPAGILKNITIGKIASVILVLLMTYLLVRLGGTALESLGRRVPRSRFFFMMMTTIVRFGLWFGSAMLLLAIVAPSRETLIAVLASAGIALGLGSQEFVKNMLGGVFILVTRPFQFGDRVKIGDAYGEIDHIGLLSTKLTTPDDTRVNIPNSEILSGKSWNANSGNLDCQVVTDLFLPQGADPAVAAGIASQSAYSSPYILLSKPVVVLVQDQFQFQPYFRIRVKAYVYDHRYEPLFQSDITLRAKADFARRGMLEPWDQQRPPDDGGAAE